MDVLVVFPQVSGGKRWGDVLCDHAPTDIRDFEIPSHRQQAVDKTSSSVRLHRQGRSVTCSVSEHPPPSTARELTKARASIASGHHRTHRLTFLCRTMLRPLRTELTGKRQTTFPIERSLNEGTERSRIAHSPVYVHSRNPAMDPRTYSHCMLSM
jgi:hypothetical protein